MIWDFIYWLRRTPWDTGVTPPEVIDLVTQRFPKGGRAIDIGCGTGTNSVYLARRGFAVLGIDVSRRAIALARKRAREASVTCEFVAGDVTRLDRLPAPGPFDLALDVGCYHVLPLRGQRPYANGLRDRMKRGGIYLLYAFCPHTRGRQQMGVSPDDVGSLFADGFLVQQVRAGEDTGSGRPSAWYTLLRV